MDLIEISQCRLISKPFDRIVQAFLEKELNFYSDNLYRKFTWYHGARSICSYNSLSILKVSLLASKSIDLHYLRRLSLHSIVENDHFDLEMLNRFESLVHLELSFEIENWSKGSQIKNIVLKNLRRLCIELKSKISNQQRIWFDSPKLESVFFECRFMLPGKPLETAVQFKHPFTVKELLAVNLLQDQLPCYFRDLERLEYNDQLELNLNDLLKTFTALKVLDIFFHKE